MGPDLESGINPSLTRRSLLRTALASGVTAGVAGASPVAAFGRELQRLDDRPLIQPRNRDGQLDSLASFQEQGVPDRSGLCRAFTWRVVAPPQLRVLR